jgi:hypothetical protein
VLWLVETLAAAAQRPEVALVCCEALSCCLLRGANVAARPLFNSLVAGVIEAVPTTSAAPLFAAAAHVLECLCVDASVVSRVLSARGVVPLLQAFAETSASDSRIVSPALSLLARMSWMGATETSIDALVGAGAFRLAAAGARGRSPTAIYFAAGLVRNVCSGSEARKDAAVAADVSSALAAALESLLDEEAPLNFKEAIITHSDGRMWALPVERQAGIEDMWDMAVNALGFAMSVLSSPSALPGQHLHLTAPEGDAVFVGADARMMHLVSAAPALAAALRENDELPGVKLALRNLAIAPHHLDEVKRALLHVGLSLQSV